MSRIIVVERKGEVSCLPMLLPFNTSRRYKIICKVNKPWNPYYVSKIKKYFELNR